jgi:hypothetical protein
VRPAHQFCQFALALLEWHSPQVFAVEFDQIESDQHRILTVALMADQIEHRQTTLVGDNGFAVEQESMSGQSRYRVHGKGNRAVKSFPLRVMSRTPAPSRRAMMRKPSCLIS